MTSVSVSEAEVPPVLVHLIDPISGRPLQTWTFESKSCLLIGRADDRDVALTDPYVSRLHAELQFRSGTWFLLSHGRNGVLVRDQLISESAVDEKVDFRLGKKGPLLRFELAPSENRSMATLNFESCDDFVFLLDQERLKREVAEIAEGDYFQSLQVKAKALRNSPMTNDERLDTTKS